MEHLLCQEPGKKIILIFKKELFHLFSFQSMNLIDWKKNPSSRTSKNVLTLMSSWSAILWSRRAFSSVLSGKTSHSPTTTRSMSLKIFQKIIHMTIYNFYVIKPFNCGLTLYIFKTIFDFSIKEYKILWLNFASYLACSDIIYLLNSKD